ncbi:MAG: glycosyltransferase [Treponema sp.]|jgi:glycosyltransferase involved in cell wall biosynthesis|nr:glycosyltransferase [Treponema sp.]
MSMSDKKTKKNSILLICRDYPNENGDSIFIKNEIKYLAEEFKRVYVLTRNGLEKNALNNQLKNICIMFDKKKSVIMIILMCFKAIFSSLVSTEIKYLMHEKKMSIISLCRLMGIYAFAQLTKKNVEKIISSDSTINLIYTYWYSYETLGVLQLKQTNKKVKCITRAHRYDLYEYGNRQKYQPFKIWMDKNIDKIFFISTHGYNYYINTFASGNQSRYSISCLGINNEYGPCEKKNGGEWNLTIISCSYIVPVKRIHLIVLALSLIDGISVRWIHIGDGPGRKKIINIAKKHLKSKENVSYEFKGFVANDFIMEFYHANFADCFISTSKSEGLPVSMMEAISFGIPLIATSVGGVPEIVNENTGILLNASSSPWDIKNALLAFYNYPIAAKRRMRKNARLLWDSKYNAATNFSKFAKELSSICTS